MIIYDLTCSRGHSFEGWFDNLEDLSAQIEKKILLCPVCGDESVSRRPSTFGLMKTQNAEASPYGSEGASGQGPLSPREQFLGRFMKRWEDFSDRLTKEFDDVGANFTDEALKMHYGVAPPRNIRGQSTEEQDLLLKKEGVTVYKMPLISRKNPSPTERN